MDLPHLACPVKRVEEGCVKVVIRVLLMNTISLPQNQNGQLSRHSVDNYITRRCRLCPWVPGDLFRVVKKILNLEFVATTATRSRGAHKHHVHCRQHMFVNIVNGKVYAVDYGAQ